jgi:Uncharacterized conserved protein (DUF2190)
MTQQARDLMNDSVLATVAITGYRAVGFDNLQATVQGQKVKGIAKRAAAIGQYCEVAMIGTSVVEAGAAIAVGATLICDAQGRAITSTGKLAIVAGAVAMTSNAANGLTDLQGADTPEYAFGDALQAAGGAGEFIEVLMRR